jgi:hypothetical protein
MKKILRLVTTSVLTLTLVACGEASTSSSVSSSTSSSVASSTSAFANVTGITLSAATNDLTQVIGSQKPVTVSATLNANTNPNLPLEWFVNDTRSKQSGRDFEFTPAAAGTFAIYAQSGSVKSNTITVTVSTSGVVTLGIESSDVTWVDASTIKIVGPGGASVAISGKTLSPESVYFVDATTGGYYLVKVTSAFAQGEKANLTLTKEGFTTFTQEIVYDTRKVEIATVQNTQPATAVAIAAVGGVYVVERPHVLNDAGVKREATDAGDADRLNVRVTFKSTALDGGSVAYRITQTAVPTGVTASLPVSGQLAITSGSLTSIPINFPVTVATVPGLYTWNLAIGTGANLKSENVSVRVDVPQAKIDFIQFGSTTKFDVEVKTSSSKVAEDSVLSAGVAAPLVAGAYEIEKDLLDYSFKQFTFSVLPKNFNVPSNLLELDATRPNQILVSMVGPDGSSLMRTTNAPSSAGSTVSPYNNTLVGPNLVFAGGTTLFRATMGAAGVKVQQRVDSSTVTGVYTYTIRVLQLGVEVAKREVKINVKAPTLDKVTVKATLTDTGSNVATDLTVPATNVLTINKPTRAGLDSQVVRLTYELENMQSPANPTANFLTSFLGQDHYGINESVIREFLPFVKNYSGPMTLTTPLSGSTEDRFNKVSTLVGLQVGAPGATAQVASSAPTFDIDNEYVSGGIDNRNPIEADRIGYQTYEAVGTKFTLSNQFVFTVGFLTTVGTYTFDLTVGTKTTTVTVNVVNPAPSIELVAKQRVEAINSTNYDAFFEDAAYIIEEIEDESEEIEDESDLTDLIALDELLTEGDLPVAPTLAEMDTIVSALFAFETAALELETAYNSLQDKIIEVLESIQLDEATDAEAEQLTNELAAAVRTWLLKEVAYLSLMTDASNDDYGTEVHDIDTYEDTFWSYDDGSDISDVVVDDADEILTDWPEEEATEDEFTDALLDLFEDIEGYKANLKDITLPDLEDGYGLTYVMSEVREFLQTYGVPNLTGLTDDTTNDQIFKITTLTPTAGVYDVTLDVAGTAQVFYEVELLNARPVTNSTTTYSAAYTLVRNFPAWNDTRNNTINLSNKAGNDGHLVSVPLQNLLHGEIPTNPNNTFLPIEEDGEYKYTLTILGATRTWTLKVGEQRSLTLVGGFVGTAEVAQPVVNGEVVVFKPAAGTSSTLNLRVTGTNLPAAVYYNTVAVDSVQEYLNPNEDVVELSSRQAPDVSAFTVGSANLPRLTFTSGTANIPMTVSPTTGLNIVGVYLYNASKQYIGFTEFRYRVITPSTDADFEALNYDDTGDLFIFGSWITGSGPQVESFNEDIASFDPTTNTITVNYELLSGATLFETLNTLDLNFFNTKERLRITDIEPTEYSDLDEGNDLVLLIEDEEDYYEDLGIAYLAFVDDEDLTIRDLMIALSDTEDEAYESYYDNLFGFTVYIDDSEYFLSFDKTNLLAFLELEFSAAAALTDADEDDEFVIEFAVLESNNLGKTSLKLVINVVEDYTAPTVALDALLDEDEDDETFLDVQFADAVGTVDVEVTNASSDDGEGTIDNPFILDIDVTLTNSADEGLIAYIDNLVFLLEEHVLVLADNISEDIELTAIAAYTVENRLTRDGEYFISDDYNWLGGAVVVGYYGEGFTFENTDYMLVLEAEDEAGNVTEIYVIINITELDDTAPTLSATSVADITDTTADLSFTSNEEGTYYYLVLAAADATPNAATIIAQGTAVAKDEGDALAAANTVEITGLTAETAYKVHLVVVDSSDNDSTVSTINLTTLEA